MILLDSSALVALVDRRDELHDRALKDLDRLTRLGLAASEPVVTESWHLLESRALRRALALFIEEHPVRIWVPAQPSEFLRSVFDWLQRYEEHDPDLTDGYLVVASATVKGYRVWTYDSEFTSIWRRPDGSRVPVA